MTETGDHRCDAILQRMEDEWLRDFEVIRSDLKQFEYKTQQVLHAVIESGEAVFQVLMSDKESDQGDLAFLFQFRIAERIKDLFIFWRDLFFQNQKGRLLQIDKQLTEIQMDAYGVQSKESLATALVEFAGFLAKEVKTLDRPDMQKQIRSWRLQNSPWPIYRQQLEEIAKQGSELIKNVQQASDYATKFQEMTTLVETTISTCHQSLTGLLEHSESVISQINQDQKVTPSNLIRRINKEEEQLTDLDFFNHFSQQLELLTTSLPKNWSAMIGIKDGFLITYDIELKNRSLQWLEGEIMPKLLEVFELTSKAKNTLRMAYANMHNRALMLSSGVFEGAEISNLLQPLHAARERVSTLIGKVKDIASDIESSLRAEFYLSKLYDLHSTFLPITMQTSIRQFGQGSNRFLSRIVSMTTKVRSTLQQILSKVEQEENLGVPEKISRYIENRQPHPSNEHYNPIFLARGFLGTSFATGRTMESNQFQNVLRNWELGYRGSVLLTGRRFCGKTFFGEWMASLSFSPLKVIKIDAGVDVMYKGRKLAASHHLAEVLNFVEKYALHDKPLIWLDDLELWQDSNYTLYENALALQKFTDNFAHRCFIMVSVNHWAYQVLKSLLNIDASFQTRIRLDHLDRSSISRAILIRHGATHKKLVDDDGSKLSAREFKALIRKIDTAAHGNIGEALRWWLSSIVPDGEKYIRCRFADEFSLPRQFDADTSLILSRILLQKQTDEYQLRKYFGQAFNDRFTDLIRRLMNMGMVVRTNNNHLEIQGSIANALGGRLLDKP